MANDTRTTTSPKNKATTQHPGVSSDAAVTVAPPAPPTPPPASSQAILVIDAFEYGDDAGQGFENQDMSDRKVPIIELLQSNSRKVVEGKGKVWAGMFHNTVTGEVCEEIFFVPAITDHCWTEWLPRDDGGGFRGRHEKGSKVVSAAVARNEGRAIGKLKIPQPPDKNGKAQPDHELVETFEIYCILYDKTGEVQGFAMIPFTSTKIKVYRAWNSAIGNFAPTLGGRKLSPGQVPLFAHRVRMTAVSETRGQYTYMLPELLPAEGGDDLRASLLPKSDPRYVAAKRLHDDVHAGLAKASYETSSGDPGADAENAAPF